MAAMAALVAATTAATPNFLFVLSDDMGYGDVGYTRKQGFQPGAGGEKWTVDPPRTPNIDALAAGSSTMVFNRWYSASPICSPTRASILSGRTPDRSCITGAEGCGTKPAWSCYDLFPFPATEFTVAEAAKSKGYATIFIGKWHLGDFWVKGEPRKTPAMQQWPASHPGMHGFDEWAATEASAPSSTTNCGCDAAWKSAGQGCVTGGGEWQQKSYDCTNYWSPTDLDAAHKPTRAECHEAMTTTRDCVANYTEKIVGDDAQFMMDVFEDFLKRKSPQGAEASPWLAQLSIHTNHEPHPALPEWYHNYTTADGTTPAGDYLGTISQFDAAFGRMVSMLAAHGHAGDTMVWYTPDNGPHTKSGGDSRPSGQLAASNGQRQCKASVFEGGIHLPGFVTWPGVISANTETAHVAVTSDFLPTVLDILGVAHPHPEWAMDGVSLKPLLSGGVPAAAARRARPLGFKLGKQAALLNDTADGLWKVLINPHKGQCLTFLEPYGSMKDVSGPFLFDLTTDPTESDDQCKAQPERCAAMAAALDAFIASTKASQKAESGCAAGKGPSPPGPPAPPPPPPTGGFELQSADGRCLVTQSVGKHALVVLGACGAGGSRWDTVGGKLVNLADGSMCLKLDSADEKACTDGNTIWMGACKDSKGGSFSVDAAGHLVAAGCAGQCAVAGAVAPAVVHYTSAGIGLGGCDAAGVLTLTEKPPPAGGWPAAGAPDELPAYPAWVYGFEH